MTSDGKVRSHRDLLVWQRAMSLVDQVYDLADEFPKREEYRLTSQLTRAVVSVPANIAEGQARSTSKDFANFLAISKGSLMEVETLLMIAVRRKYASERATAPIFSEITELSKMLTSLRSKILQGKRQ